MFKQMLEEQLQDISDILTIDEVASLMGYNPKTILRYVQKQCFYAVIISGKYYISKRSVINYLATDKAFKNKQKSEWHNGTILLFIQRK